jgi:hypothetical protein
MDALLKKRRAESGVALVITLIMLSVITIIAVAFLLLSQRERSSVSSTIVATDAELALNSAVERAKADIMADFEAFFFSNPTNRTFTNALGQWTVRRYLGPDLMVSTTFTNSTNSYLSSAPIPPPNQASFMTNLHYDPRVPVFNTNRVDRARDGWTNRNTFYIDLNRNGIFDESGFVLARDGLGRPILGKTNYVVGDPEWVGVLSRLDEPHSGTNRFIGRYAYLIAPAGRTEDINFIHNRVKPTPGGQEGFYRNQGHGSWEINLAAFLADLNADQWNVLPYGFNLSLNVPSSGTAFQDAFELLKYRYDYPLTTLRSARTVFGTYAQAFQTDGIDEYADGITGGVGEDDETKPWPGAPNPHQFFSIHDFFNAKNPSITNFQAKLYNAGFSNDTYNAHTFYRMLAQLGTDSIPEKMRVTWDNQGRPNDDARINLNYANTNEVSAAEFKPWTAQTFLQVAGDRLLREYGHAIDPNTRLSVTNLPVYKVVGARVTNYYTPDVHRILQMTLNIYDAMTTNYYPTALKPRLANVNGDVVITGYDEMINSGNITNAINWIDLNDPAQRANPQDKFAYGIPVLIGVKKGFPNFNEAAFQNDVQFERKLQVVKTQQTRTTQGGVPQGTVTLTKTNQIFFIGVSNSFGMEAWNSYSNAYPRPLTVYSAVDTTVCITNDDGMAPWITNRSVVGGLIVPANTWRGGEFQIPDHSVPNATGLWTNQVALDYKVYFQKTFYPSNEVQWSEAKFPAVQWGVSTTNHIRFFILDRATDRIIDAVGLAPLGLSTNMTQAVTNDSRYAVFWEPNQAGNVTAGMRDQLLVSQGKYLAVPRFRLADWDKWGYFDQRGGGVNGFTNFLAAITPSNIMVAPFTPQVKAYRRVIWRANDPLVHYMDADLRYDLRVETKGSHVSITRSPERGEYALEFGRTNFPVVWTKANEYAPWDPPPDGDASKTLRHANLHLMDPNIRSSNDWDFPTNASPAASLVGFPSIGWLGRVHRGTPWQTIYLKPWFPTNEWGLVHYSMRAHPTNDWLLADIFTVAQHPNASRGRLSVNQTNLAAWSAVLGGIDVTRLTANGKARTNMEPAAIGDTNVQWIVEGINARRESLPGKVFNNLEEFLSVPELTTSSPFLMPPPAPANDPLTDDDYEGLARGIISLVKPGERRFVIYAFGQSLKPAPQSVILGGTYRGLCLNYEVTGEMAARAVVRIDLEYPQPPQPGPPRPRAVVESFNILPPD